MCCFTVSICGVLEKVCSLILLTEKRAVYVVHFTAFIQNEDRNEATNI